MAQITYSNKTALNENSSIPSVNKVEDTDMNEIKQVVNDNETKILVAITDTAPSTCSIGDVYFNTTTNLLYNATATDTWSSTGVAPTENTLYVIFSTQTSYIYNGTTLISLNGGGYSTTTETNTGKIWIDGKPIYRMVYDTTLPNCTTDGTSAQKSVGSLSNLDLLISTNLIITGSSFKSNLNLYSGDTPENGVRCFWNKGTSTLYLRNANTAYNGAETYIVIEYTKTS